MEIKDYLHLYLGCEVEVEGKRKKVKRSGILMSVQVHSGIVIQTEGKDAFCSFENNIIRPVLNPLQYALKEEIEHMLWLVTDSPFHLEPDCRISKEEAAFSIDSIEPDDNAIVVYFTLRCFEGKLYISSHSGLIRLYDEEDKEQPIEFKPALFQYLLSRQFDLFGLIDAGLAIDKSQLINSL